MEHAGRRNRHAPGRGCLGTSAAPARDAPTQRASIGAAAAGTFYELLNEDRRRAIEIVVEDKAGYRDPEVADGNLPELESPSGRSVP